MSEADIENIKITTPLGDCLIPFNRQEIIKFVKQVAQENENRNTIHNQDVAEFLEIEIGDEDEEYEWWDDIYVPSRLYDLEQFIAKEYKICKITNYSRRGMKRNAVVKKKMKFPHGHQSLVVKGTYFLENENGVKFVISLSPVDGFNLDLRICYDASVCSPTDFFEPFMKYHHSEGILKNSHFNSKMGFIEYQEKEWNDIVLSETQQKSIDRNITKFIENMSLFQARNLSSSRGVLITGPPGTGKTLLCNTIMSQTKCTFIYITSESVNNKGDIHEMYELARSLSPTIIVVEDIDTLGAGDREQNGGDHPLLGEFLNCLAGIEKNDQVVTIATTNYPQYLDKALIDRPGRFDVRIDFGLPDEELRETILKRYLREIKHTKINFKSLVKKCEGMSGAYLKEIVMSSYMEALEQNDYNEDFVLDSKIILKNAEKIAEKRHQYQFHRKKDTVSDMHL